MTEKEFGNFCLRRIVHVRYSRSGQITGLFFESDTGLTCEEMGRFPKLEHIQELRLPCAENFTTEKSLHYLLRFQSLESIILRDVSVSRDTVFVFAKFPKLKKLHVQVSCTKEEFNVWNKVLGEALKKGKSDYFRKNE